MSFSHGGRFVVQVWREIPGRRGWVAAAVPRSDLQPQAEDVAEALSATLKARREARDVRVLDTRTGSSVARWHPDGLRTIP